MKGRLIHNNLQLAREVIERKEETPEPHWLVWISPRPSKPSPKTDGLLCRRPPDSNQSSTNGSAFCTIASTHWYRLTVSARSLSRSNGWSSRVTPCPLCPYFVAPASWGCNPACRRTPMISQSLCFTVRIQKL